MINRTSEEIFTISSDNLTEMILEYFESVSGPGSLLDHLGDYREYCVSDEAVLSGHPEIAEMITRDRFGEEIGTSFRGILDVEKLCSRSEKETDTLYFDREDRLAAYRKLTDPERPDRMYDAEVFEYAGDLRYSKSSGCITCGEENYGFSFFRYSKGAVAEFLKVIGNFGGYGNEDPFELKLPSELKVNHYVFDDTPEHKPVRMDHYELSYTKTTGRYMIVRSFDRLNPPPKKAPVKRVIDSQKKLCASLTKKIPEKTTLAQATELFFEVIGGAKPNEEEMLLYEVGYGRNEAGTDTCYVSLVRQTPTKHDEFYQLHLELTYEITQKDPSLKECKWHEVGDEDLKEYILQSKAYKAFGEITPATVSVWVDET